VDPAARLKRELQEFKSRFAVCDVDEMKAFLEEARDLIVRIRGEDNYESYLRMVGKLECFRDFISNASREGKDVHAANDTQAENIQTVRRQISLIEYRA
jgi:hypothetical protein